MKNIHFKSCLLIAAIAILSAACKDSDFDNYKIQSVDNHGTDAKMIGFNASASSTVNFVPYAVVPSHDVQVFNLIQIALSSINVASEDIHVTIAPDTAYLNAYNHATFDDFNDDGTTAAENPDLYYVMPDPAVDPASPAYTLVSNVVTIPKGQSIGYVQISTTSYDYFASHGWAFAYKVVSVDGGIPISGNSFQAIGALIPENKYDGKYDLQIETDGWAVYGISDGLPGDYGTIDIVTTGLTSNILGNPIAGGNLQPAFSTGNATKTAFGATGPVFVFDSNDKITSVYNSVPDDGRGRAFALDPAADPTKTNYFDPATKTIYAQYLMMQVGRTNQKIICTMTYKGPR